MATVFVASASAGSILRAFTFARWLRADGVTPVVFALAQYAAATAKAVPGVTIGNGFGMCEPSHLSYEIETYAERNRPALVVVDAEATAVCAGIRVREEPLEGRRVSRVMVVSPRCMRQLRVLNERYADAYDEVVMLDHPRSPTWPFGPADTAEVAEWQRWRCVGPFVGHRASTARLALERPHAIETKRPLVVCLASDAEAESREAGGPDVQDFLTAAAAAARRMLQYDPTIRFAFVRTGRFIEGVKVPAPLEDWGVEIDRAKALAVASRVIIESDPGLIWESAGAGTPFLPVAGRFKEEHERIARRLARVGLMPASINAWLRDSFVARFRRAVEQHRRLWSSRELARAIQSVVTLAPATARPAVPPPAPVSNPTVRGAGPHLLVRFDDIGDLAWEVTAIIDLCATYGLRLSLDIVPYLCRFTEDDLRALKLPAGLVEVAQHGFCHLPRFIASGRKAEFVSTEGAETLIARGLARMLRWFPVSFRGGYSAPYDVLLPEIADTWRQLGGRYLSTMSEPPPGMSLPHVRLHADPWDWWRRAPRPLADVLAALERGVAEQGVAGLVLHPAPLRRSGELDRMRDLFREISERGFTGVAISNLATRGLRSRG